MRVKDRLRAAIDNLSEEEAAAVLLAVQRERDDIDRRATAHAAMRDAMASAEALADDEQPP